MPKFALRSSRAPLLLRQLRPGDVFQPAVTSNKLCRIPGSGSRSSEDNAALREREKKKKSLFFFHRLLIEMARLQKPQELEYHRDKPTKQICTSQRGLLHLQAADVSLFHSLLAVYRRKTFTSFCTSPYTAHLKNQRAGVPITWTNCRVFITANCQYLSVLGRH